MTTFRHVDRKSKLVLEALAIAPVFKKQGAVKARPAKPGERVNTVLACGTTETTNTAVAGDWVVTNPSGERHIVSAEKFPARYEPTDHEGIYAAKGFCRAIPNPFGRPIEIMASWGKPQTGAADCMIADTCDADGNADGEPYIIERLAFTQTYKEQSLVA